jgi:hypothetical protein
MLLNDGSPQGGLSMSTYPLFGMLTVDDTIASPSRHSAQLPLALLLGSCHFRQFPS